MINQLVFTVEIEAKSETIWNALWDDQAYRQWTAVFFEGSYAVSDGWIEGSIVHFLAPGENGIYSRIEKHSPNRYIEFKHIGNVINGEEQPLDEETRKWSGATESYQLIQGERSYTLKVEIDVMDEHLESMSDAFPKALEVIKNNCIG
ncbi:MAG: hypothetical protein AAF466_03140 [Bacteroidota bacterium]